MPTKSHPLLCELHAHTTWSDGSLTVRELCDLYGRRGFDVLAVTDHAPREPRHIQEGNFAAYLEDSGRPDFEAFLVCRIEDDQLVGFFNVSQITRGSLQSAYLGYAVAHNFARDP